MPNDKDISKDTLKRSRIGYVNRNAKVSEETQLRRLEIEEVGRIYYNWSDIEGNVLREKDTLFVYDLEILGSTRKIMSQRIAWLMNKGVGIQVSTGNRRVAKLPPFKYQYAVHMAHVRANTFYRERQTNKASNAPKKRMKKIKQPLSDRILISYYQKALGELSNETVGDTAKRLKTDTRAYYMYLDRILVSVANGESPEPMKMEKSVFKRLLRLRQIRKKGDNYVDTKLKRKKK